LTGSGLAPKLEFSGSTSRDCSPPLPPCQTSLRPFRDRLVRPPRLAPQEIDKNSYRAPIFRQRSPRQMPKRRKAGWTFCRFVLDLRRANSSSQNMADDERAERSKAARGLRRRRPRTKNFYVIEGLNYIFEQYGMPEFCVQEVEPMPGRVRRFVAPT
jgi:hypothetical protein